ncbi:MAG: class I SAM-dependent methyltransferase, partial [Tumebacillaceae bacterium]
MAIRPMLGFVRDLLSGVLQPGDVAIDGTVGKGQDTLFLAMCVGEDGHVLGCDIQEQALERTRKRVEEAGLLERVTFVQGSHAHLQEMVSPDWMGRVKAVMFNLGYLPGGDEG